MTGMTGLLEGRVALLTGAGTGLGRGIGLSFAQAGARVALLARSRAVPEETAALIRAQGGEAITLTGDVTDRASLDRAVARTCETFGGLDIAVQIAAHGQSNMAVAVEHVSLDLWDEHVAMSLRSCVNLAQAAYSALKASGRGRYIAISSAYGLAGDATNPMYAAMKGGLRGFAKSLAKEWGDDAITVNLFAPSSMSENTRDYFERHPDAWAIFREAIPMRRMGDPQTDIGSAVTALAGDQFRFVSGQTIPIDGGFYTTL